MNGQYRVNGVDHDWTYTVRACPGFREAAEKAIHFLGQQKDDQKVVVTDLRTGEQIAYYWDPGQLEQVPVHEAD